MEAAHLPWRPLGELFVSRGLITGPELEEALAEQAATGGRLGDILVKRNLISSPELTEALMEQLGREVAKEEGFGSGLWREIQRRNARQVDGPPLALVVDDERPVFDGALTQALEASASTYERTEPHEPVSESTDLADAADPREIEELRHEVAELRAAEVKKRERKDAGRLAQELDAARREMEVRGARLSELERTLVQRDERIGELERALARAATHRTAAAETGLQDTSRPFDEEGEAHAEARRRAKLVSAATSVWETFNSRHGELEIRLAEESAGHADAKGALARALDELAHLRDGHGPASVPEPEAEYIAFTPGAKGYRLVARTGPCPRVGAGFELDGALYVVTRTGSSPLPSDTRRCAYLQHA